MWQFEYPDRLYAFFLILFLIIIFVLMRIWQKRAIRQFAEAPLLLRLLPAKSRYKPTLKFSLRILAIFFIIVAWANPQKGLKRQAVRSKNADYFIALDISNSMRAKDLLPNRLERAKEFCLALTRQLDGNRMGLILFAGTAKVQVPITENLAQIQTLLKAAQPNMISTQGTVIGEAIGLAMRSFEPENKQSKAIIIISDGENHEGDAVEMARQAASKGGAVFTVGVGGSVPTSIPEVQFGYETYLKDGQGDLVKTKMDETMLQEIAKAGYGRYFRLRNDEGGMKKLTDLLSKIEKRMVEQRVFDEFESYYQWAIGAALLFLLLDFLTSYRQSDWWQGRDLFK